MHTSLQALSCTSGCSVRIMFIWVVVYGALIPVWWQVNDLKALADPLNGNLLGRGIPAGKWEFWCILGYRWLRSCCFAVRCMALLQRVAVLRCAAWLCCSAAVLRCAACCSRVSGGRNAVLQHFPILLLTRVLLCQPSTAWRFLSIAALCLSLSLSLSLFYYAQMCSVSHTNRL